MSGCCNGACSAGKGMGEIMLQPMRSTRSLFRCDRPRPAKMKLREGPELFSVAADRIPGHFSCAFSGEQRVGAATQSVFGVGVARAGAGRLGGVARGHHRARLDAGQTQTAEPAE